MFTFYDIAIWQYSHRVMDQVEEIKQKTDIVALIGEYVDLKKAGRNFKTNCPFHSEKTPSFIVSPELQIYKCFGCGESGDAYSFLQKFEGMDFYESLKFLADRSGVELKVTSGTKRSEKQKLYEAANTVNRFYQYVLHNHPAGKKAMSYLTQQRKLTMDTIKTFQLGYSPDVSFALGKLVEKKKLNLPDIDKIGITYNRSGKYYDRFRGRVVFPLHDHRDNVVGFAGRIMPGARTDLAKYINTPETLIYHKSNLLYGLNIAKKDIKKKKKVIVVEGELDAISSYQIGIKNVIALKGSAFTEAQAKLLSRFAQSAVLALDADAAGDEAAKRGIVIAEKEGLEVSVAQIKNYKDPDEMAHKDPQALKKVIKKPISVWDFLLGSIFSKFNKKTGSGKAKISKAVVPVLSSIDDAIVQAHYIKKVANALGVPEDAVSRQVRKPSSERSTKERDIPATTSQKVSRRELLERRLMALAFSTDPGLLKKRKYKKLLVHPFTKKLMSKYLSFSKTHRTFSPSEFSSSLSKELVDGFAEMILSDSDDNNKVVAGSNISVTEMDPQRELDLVVGELELIDTKEKLHSLTDDIKKYEQQKQKSKLKKAQKDFSAVSATIADLEERLRQ